MTMMKIFDSDTSAAIGDLDIPDDVIEAAEKVAAWLRRHETISLCGLKLAEY